MKTKMAQKVGILNKLRLSFGMGMAITLMATMAPLESIAGIDTQLKLDTTNAELLEMQAPAALPHYPGDTIFLVVQHFPEFPGGEDARHRFIAENLRYPLRALEAGIQGIVFVSFIVEKDGSITDVRVIRGVGGGLDEEVVRVVESMPKWIPGRQGDKPVRVQFTMPFRFIRTLRTIETH